MCETFTVFWVLLDALTFTAADMAFEAIVGPDDLGCRSNSLRAQLGKMVVVRFEGCKSFTVPLFFQRHAIFCVKFCNLCRGI